LQGAIRGLCRLLQQVAQPLVLHRPVSFMHAIFGRFFGPQGAPGSEV
jgi:hypothetical protein